MVMGEQTREAQLAVIGGGPGGYTAAFRAADLGLDVLLISAEQNLGGVCLQRGCIPVKTYMEVANLLRSVDIARDWGVNHQDLEIDLDQLRGRKQEVVDRLVGGLHSLAEAREIEIINAEAVFSGPGQLRLNKGEIDIVEFEQAVLATGTHPRLLPEGIMPERDSRIMDTEQALTLPDVPEKLLVIGAAHSGLEISSIYAALGSKVTLVEMLPELLPDIDDDLVQPLKEQMEASCEQLFLGTKVKKLTLEEDGVRAHFEGDGIDQPEQLFDRAVLSIGREPNSADIGLDQAGIELDERGYVVIDEQLRTTNDRVFAVGDITGVPMVAHKALHQGKIAAEVIAGQASAFDVRCIPVVVYVEPQVAICGTLEKDAEREGRDVEVKRYPWRASGRALTMDATEGLTKFIIDPPSGRILGVGIVGPKAENLINEAVLAIEMGAVVEDLALTMHPHPTLSETVQEAAEASLGLATHLKPS